MRNKIVLILSLVVGVEAITVITGWVLGVDSLTRIFPSQGNNMAFPTSVMFLLSAIALYLLSRKKDNEYGLPQLTLSGIVLALYLIIIAILVGGFTNAQTGVRNLFMQIQGEPVRASALLTLICFFLYGMIVFFSISPSTQNKKVIKIFGYSILVISAIDLVGYIFKLPFQYYKLFDWEIPMALNTAITFIILCIGLVLVSGIKSKNEA